MLRSVMDMRLNEANENVQIVNNSEARELTKECRNLETRIGEFKPEISKELDFLIGKIILAYSKIYFEAGFKDGMKLIMEEFKVSIK